ncbi:LOW QUALITY PROTEIN: GSK-3-binding protein-like [Macrochelys suwanniensis]
MYSEAGDGSGEEGGLTLDVLVAKLGEVPLSAQRAPPPCNPKHPPPTTPHQPAEPQRLGKNNQRVAEQLCGQSWLRSAAHRRKRPWPRELPGEEEDPHRLLQQLILSGNLIKEAVRRLHSAPKSWCPRQPPH